MALIQSISGIRGTLGGAVGQALTPPDVIRYITRFGQWLKVHHPSPKVLLGRDARPSGPMLAALVGATLQSTGVSVVDLGLASTPTVAMSTLHAQAQGGIVITASHNPPAWNGLKLLNSHGECIDAKLAAAIDTIAHSCEAFVENAQLGTYTKSTDHLAQHISHILGLSLVDWKAIQTKKFKIAVDGANSVGGTAVPALLEALGVETIIPLHCVPSGHFAHDPEPLPENLTELCQSVRDHGCDLGVAVDPDVDRLAFVNEHGLSIGEEYTVVLAADYVLSHTPGNTVSNLSSSQALRDITIRYGRNYTASAVGEVNVVAAMKATKAVIGGEGNGGIIYPPLHYGRDALVGIALVLSYLARSGARLSELHATYPQYFMSKRKVYLPSSLLPQDLFSKLAQMYQGRAQDHTDGIKIMFDSSWIHVRSSNTEPIVRVYTEALSMHQAQEIAETTVRFFCSYGAHL